MSGCDRILARLERGPATAAELYAETYCVVHSRISDLRKRGHDIESFRIADKTGAASYGYRLKTSTGAPSSGGAVPPLVAPAPVEQLSLGVAA